MQKNLLRDHIKELKSKYDAWNVAVGVFTHDQNDKNSTDARYSVSVPIGNRPYCCVYDKDGTGYVSMTPGDRIAIVSRKGNTAAGAILYEQLFGRSDFDIRTLCLDEAKKLLFAIERDSRKIYQIALHDYSVKVVYGEEKRDEQAETVAVAGMIKRKNGEYYLCELRGAQNEIFLLRVNDRFEVLSECALNVCSRNKAVDMTYCPLNDTVFVLHSGAKKESSILKIKAGRVSEVIQGEKHDFSLLAMCCIKDSLYVTTAYNEVKMLRLLFNGEIIYTYSNSEIHSPTYVRSCQNGLAIVSRGNKRVFYFDEMLEYKR
jgi:hypothetical protein